MDLDVGRPGTSAAARDDPPLDGVATRALDVGWTRDPFDRSIAAHALYRGWRLATSDAGMLEHMPAGMTVAL